MTGEDAADGLGVSRETQARFEVFAGLLKRWNARINLISKASEDALWTRHIEDSAQLFHLAPEAAQSWIDLGSGAGFPGLVVAILAAEARPQLTVTLVESDTRKAAFLAAAVRELQLRARVQPVRIENADPGPYDVISARALAALPQLLAHSARFRHAGTICLFPKGRRASSELTAARRGWHIEVVRHPSRTDPAGSILEVRGFTPIP